MSRFFLVVLLLSLSTLLLSQGSAQNSQGSTAPKSRSSFKNIFYGQPGKAALYSLILPGGGQFYNRRYWKIPLVWAGEGYAVYNLINTSQIYGDLNSCNIALINGEISPPVCGGIDNPSTAFSRAQSARSNREMAWIFVGLAHLLNVLDAFIDRHLINFDTTNDLSTGTLYQSHLEASRDFRSNQIKLFQVNISLNNWSD